MQNIFKTDRLLLDALTPNDTEFILELVNAPEWIKFIGDRNVKSKEDAGSYIQKILSAKNVTYWVARLKNDQTAIGIITFIKRDYLEHFDIGFAFLNTHGKKGYAYEASKVVLDYLINDSKYSNILATTIKDNEKSIRLLEKLGFNFYQNKKIENGELLVYSLDCNQILIDKLTDKFFSIFTNKNQQIPNWEIINEVCLPETIIIKKVGLTEEVYGLKTFTEPRKKILSNGTLTDFEEYEINQETKIIGNIAQRYSKYKKSGYLNGQRFTGDGNKFFQFIKTEAGWKINSVVWEDNTTEQ